jgi:hypothetical protein
MTRSRLIRFPHAWSKTGSCILHRDHESTESGRGVGCKTQARCSPMTPSPTTRAPAPPRGPSAPLFGVDHTSRSGWLGFLIRKVACAMRTISGQLGSSLAIKHPRLSGSVCNWGKMVRYPISLRFSAHRLDCQDESRSPHTLAYTTWPSPRRCAQRARLQRQGETMDVPPNHAGIQPGHRSLW